jgi:RNA polymerase sigma factor (TIGR02999 family)
MNHAATSTRKVAGDACNGIAAVRPEAVTELLGALRAGVPGALERLLPLIYEDLSRIAHRQLRLELTGHTLCTTALVHEAYLRLVDQTRAQWADRTQFLAIAARVMRRVLVDHARRHRAVRRGGRELRRVPLELLLATDSGELAVEERADVLVALDAALDVLSRLEPRQARVVECRFFGGLTEDETADALGVTPRTVARDWVKARGWLLQELTSDSG